PADAREGVGRISIRPRIVGINSDLQRYRKARVARSIRGRTDDTARPLWLWTVDCSLSAGPHGASRIAARLREVKVDVADGFIGEHRLERGLERSAFSEVGGDEHVVPVEPAQRDRAGSQQRRHLADLTVRLRDTFPHVDCMRSTEWGLRGLVLVVNEQDRLADFRIREAHAAREARLLVDDLA